MIKKFSFGLMAVVALIVFSVSQANASLVNSLIKLQDGPGSGNGGEFKVYLQPNNTTAFFHTFCCELSEVISFGTTYKIQNLSTTTVLSGKSLTTDTAWLFASWWNGSNKGLTNSGTFNLGSQSYALGGGRNADARSLQLAIWYTMGWNSASIWTSGGYAAEYALNAKAQTWVTEAQNVESSSYSTDFGVRVMNLTDSNGFGNFQDQLTLVPEPGSFLIWTMVAAGMGSVVSRRRRAVR